MDYFISSSMDLTIPFDGVVKIGCNVGYGMIVCFEGIYIVTADERGRCGWS